MPMALFRHSKQTAEALVPGVPRPLRLQRQCACVGTPGL
jgi:hypothetical protein